MPNIRIKDIPTTASATSSTDFIGIDGSANGTRKLDAYSPTFGGNLTVSGTGGITSSSISPLFKATSSALGSAPKLTLENTNLGAWNVYLSGTDGGDFKIDQDSTNKLRIAYGTGNATLAGNLTVSGTGTSSVAGKLAVGITSTSSVIEGYTASAISGADGLTNLRLSYKGGPNAGDGGAQITFAQQYTGAQPDTLIRVGGVRGIKTIGTGSFGGGVQLLYQTAAAVDMSVGATLNSNGNLLLGTTTDGGQKLQVAGNLYVNNSSATHTVAWLNQSNASYNTDLNLSHVSAASSAIISRRASGELWLYMTGADAIKCYTNSALALTLDSSQRCILAGALRLNNAYTASAVVPTGYVTIQDSTGTTYKVCVLL